MCDRYAAIPAFITPRQYAKEKLKMLKRDMCICPTEEEKRHVYSLTTERDIDRACLSIIDRRWK